MADPHRQILDQRSTPLDPIFFVFMQFLGWNPRPPWGWGHYLENPRSDAVYGKNIVEVWKGLYNKRAHGFVQNCFIFSLFF